MIVYREVSTLAQDLGIRTAALYAVSNHRNAHYRRVEIPKRDGTVRQLSVPDPLLKCIQRRISQRLLAFQPVSPYAMAYRYGTSPVKNAALHVGKNHILKLDILHFFDSVLYSDVKERAFPPEVYAEPLRILLAMLCYDRDQLPQGAPSSPAIANLVLKPFDDEVGAWCVRRGITYSRYCDDLTFSSNGDLEGVRDYAERRLRAFGFFPNHRKTVSLHRGQRQIVTGLVVNQRVSVPAEYRRRLRQELYYCRRFGVESHLEYVGTDLAPVAYLKRLLGQVGYWLQADPDSHEASAAQEWLKGELQRRKERLE